MGRAGIRRRKTPRHLRKLQGPMPKNSWGTEHSPWTVEGRIEAIGVMGRGMRDASDRQWRYLGKLAAGALGIIVAVGIAFWLVGLVTG